MHCYKLDTFVIGMEGSKNPPTKELKKPHGSGHDLAQCQSNVTGDWDHNLGLAIDHFSPLHLPTVRAVLQRYRHLHTENLREKISTIASVITKEVTELWDKAWIPHYEDELSIYNIVLKAIDMWANSSHCPQNRAKPEFQGALDQLLDIRPQQLWPIEALEKHLRMSRNKDQQSDLTFFKGQLKVSKLAM